MSPPKDSYLSQENGKHIISLPITENLTCLKCMSPKKIRFEVEYSLGKGTTANSFLFTDGSHDKLNALLVHPPGRNFEEVFLPELIESLSTENTNLVVVVGHVNPNRVYLLKRLVEVFTNIKFIASNPAEKL